MEQLKYKYLLVKNSFSGLPIVISYLHAFQHIYTTRWTATAALGTGKLPFYLPPQVVCKHRASVRFLARNYAPGAAAPGTAAPEAAAPGA